MSFDKQPSLSGKLISVRPLRDEDFPTLFAAAADPLLWEQHPASNRYQEDVFRDFFADAIDSGGALLVTDIESDEVIGSSRFHAYSEDNRSFEIGQLIDEAELIDGIPFVRLEHVVAYKRVRGSDKDQRHIDACI